MRFKYYLIIVIVIFFAERLAVVSIPWPAFFFPIFSIVFLLLSPKLDDDLLRIIGAGLFFDYFSGFVFGSFTLMILILILVAYFIRRQILIKRDSLISILAYSLSLLTGFIFLYLPAIEFRLILIQTPIILTEGLILTVIYFFLIKKIQSYDTRQI